VAGPVLIVFPLDFLLRKPYYILMIPQGLRPLFWDIDLRAFDPLCFPEYTITRVLEYGDQEAVAWLQTAFSQDAIKQVIGNERRLSRRSANFWALIYEVPPEEVAALKNGR
jgi:hypothetical protein